MAGNKIVNEVRRGLYLDSVALMRMSRTVAAMDGVVECGMMMGTPANMRIMTDAGVLADAGRGAAPGDLVIAISAKSQSTADAALVAARGLLDAPKARDGATSSWAPRTIRAAVTADPDSNLALISVPGAFAAAEARKALLRGLNVLMFSDNVPIADERALKELARDKGLLMMGPDCGTAIIGGTALGFANVVPHGDIGIIGASGTGIQEVSCLIANAGGGISHAIGVGGRDLKREVGGITTLMAIDLLDQDATTKTIVIISKPPDPDVARQIALRAAKSDKRFVLCFVGGAADLGMLGGVAPNCRFASRLNVAAVLALGRPLREAAVEPDARAPGKHIRGLFAGGTLCAEAQDSVKEVGFKCASNVPIPGVETLRDGWRGHTLIDLGDDAYTQGRPHPMIEPAVRDAPLLEALADASVGVVLVDIVLGFGAHADPAGHLAAVLRRAPKGHPLVVASVTGTAGDPQGLQAQCAKLEQAGVIVAGSTTAATRIAVRHVGGTFEAHLTT